MGLERYPVSWSYLVMSVILGAGWALSLGMSRVYDRKVLGIGVEEYKRLANSSLRYWGLVAIVCFLAHVELARGFLAVAFPVGTAALLVGRWVARKLLHRARARSGGWSHRVLVVGAPDEVRDLVVQLRRSPYAGLEVVGACVPGGERIRMRAGRGRAHGGNAHHRAAGRGRYRCRHGRRHLLARHQQQRAQAARLGARGSGRRPRRRAGPDGRRWSASARATGRRTPVAPRRAAGVHRSDPRHQGRLRPAGRAGLPGGARAADARHRGRHQAHQSRARRLPADPGGQPWRPVHPVQVPLDGR